VTIKGDIKSVKEVTVKSVDSQAGKNKNLKLKTAELRNPAKFEVKTATKAKTPDSGKPLKIDVMTTFSWEGHGIASIQPLLNGKPISAGKFNWFKPSKNSFEIPQQQNLEKFLVSKYKFDAKSNTSKRNFVIFQRSLTDNKKMGVVFNAKAGNKTEA
jgi:hypothetical protein